MPRDRNVRRLATRSPRRLAFMALLAAVLTLWFAPTLITLLLFLATGGLTFLVLYTNLRTAQRGIVPDAIVLRLGQSVPRAPQVDVTRILQRASLPISLFLALLAGFAGASAWDVVLRLI